MGGAKQVMERIESNCVGCGFPCRSTCRHKSAKHFYCDECEAETTLYHYKDKQICADCLLYKFDIVEGSDYD